MPNGVIPAIDISDEVVSSFSALSFTVYDEGGDAIHLKTTERNDRWYFEMHVTEGFKRSAYLCPNILIEKPMAGDYRKISILLPEDVVHEDLNQCKLTTWTILDRWGGQNQNLESFFKQTNITSTKKSTDSRRTGNAYLYQVNAAQAGGAAGAAAAPEPRYLVNYSNIGEAPSAVPQQTKKRSNELNELCARQPKSPKMRLKELKECYEEKLITETEYQDIRKEILKILKEF